MSHIATGVDADVTNRTDTYDVMSYIKNDAKALVCVCNLS